MNSPTYQPYPTNYGPLMKNGLGTGSLIFSILSLMFFWVPVLGLFAYITAGTGIILGYYGSRRAKHGVASNGGVATTGMALSALGLLLVFFMTIVWGAVLSENVDEPAVATSTSTKDSDSDSETSEAAGVGDSVRDGKFEFTVRSVEDGVKSIGQGFMAEKPQGQFVLVRVTVQNIGDEAQWLSASDQFLYDADGREYSADDTAWIALESNPLLEQINPGNSVKGTIVFDVPRGAKLASLELHDSLFSGGVKISLK